MSFICLIQSIEKWQMKVMIVAARFELWTLLVRSDRFANRDTAAVSATQESFISVVKMLMFSPSDIDGVKRANNDAENVPTFCTKCNCKRAGALV